MKQNNIRITSLLLALLTVGAAFVSCGDSSNDSNQADTSPTSQSKSTDTAVTDAIKDNLPELNYGGDTIKIYNFGFEPAVRRDASGGENSGDVVDDAVHARNLAVEERLGVSLSFTAGSDSWETYPNEVSKMIKAADCPYDLIFMESSQCFRLMLDGNFRELSALPYIDLEQPWWYKAFMDGSAISTDKRYLLTGAFSITTLEFASATIFNKKIYNNLFEDYNELYTLVDEHKWTYDKMIEYCVDAYQDINGNGVADDADQYGLFNRGQQTVNYVSMSTGLTYLKRDSNNLPQLDIYNDDSVRWVEKLYRILKEDNISYRSENINGVEHFASGRALFFLGQLTEYVDPIVRNMEDPYGVLPMPILDEGMEYRSAAGTVNGESAVIPVTTPEERLDPCAAVLESLSIEAYRTVLPAWYEVALKSKYSDTARDSEMIDVIYNTIDTSFIMIADKLLGSGSFFWNMLGDGKRTPGEFASYYETQSKNLQKKWDKMISDFQALE